MELDQAGTHLAARVVELRPQIYDFNPNSNFNLQLLPDFKLCLQYSDGRRFGMTTVNFINGQVLSSMERTVAS